MIEVACVCIVNENNQLLIAEKQLGVFEFPGGKKQANESLFDCAIREIQEELSIAVQPKIVCKETVAISTNKGSFLLYLILAKGHINGINLNEHLSFEFHPLESFPFEKLGDSDRQLAKTNWAELNQRLSSCSG